MAKPYYEFFCPVKVIAGHAALEHIPFELATLGAKAFIITDKGVRANKLLEPIEAAFGSTDTVIGYIFDDVPPDSSLQTVRRAAELYREHGCDAIIAIGGGSVIDTSKATNILVSEGGDDLLKYSGAHNLPKPLKPFLLFRPPQVQALRPLWWPLCQIRKKCQNGLCFELFDASCCHFRPAHDPDVTRSSHCNDWHGCFNPLCRSLYLPSRKSN